MAPLSPSDLPSGYTDHGVKGLVCTSAEWSSVLLFYVANYLAHCATVKTYPAETAAELAIAIFSALFLPSSGISRALDSIVRRPRLRKLSELRRACVAGALCMVVRTGYWAPAAGDIISDVHFPVEDFFHSNASFKSTPPSAAGMEQANDLDREDGNVIADIDDQTARLLPDSAVAQEADQPDGSRLTSDGYYYFLLKLARPPWIADPIRTSQTPQQILFRNCKIHGAYSLPPGYAFAYVPSNALFKEFDSSDGRMLKDVKHEISSSYSFTKSAIAIVQTIYAGVTLYRARGDQIHVYGYAAFGLTVVPYIMMSIMNFAAQLVSPDYPNLYMVETEEMEEARRHGGFFQGAVGTIERGHLAEKTPSQTGVKPLSSIPNRWKVTKELGSNRFEFESVSSEKTGEDPAAVPTFTITVEAASYKPWEGHGTREVHVYVPTCSRLAQTPNKDSEASTEPSWEWYGGAAPRTHDSALLSFFAPAFVGLVALLIVGVLSRFQKGTQSTNIERGFTMAWLVTGMLFGIVARWLRTMLLDMPIDASEYVFFGAVAIVLFGVFLVPALGGFIIVGKMVKEYGSCTRVD